jgi:HPt (histidine-containing phosphotransfer) domain-containing protein
MKPVRHNPRDSEREAKGEKACDSKRTMEMIRGNPSRFEEIAEMFLRTVPKSLDEIDKGIAAGDMRAVEHAAQTLKDSICNLGEGLTYEVEQIIGEEGAEQAANSLSNLRTQLNLIEKVLCGSIQEK